jgi:quercetin dioxygenase-like cupin family protein
MGSGWCKSEEGSRIPLQLGKLFVLPPDTVHGFVSNDEGMTVIAYHPDSDTGPTDVNHPMINRTIVDGVSASKLPAIQTKR